MINKRNLIIVGLVIFAFLLWRAPVLLGLLLLVLFQIVLHVAPIVIVTVIVYKFIERRRKIL